MTLDLERIDGSKRKARFLFDSGGGAVVLKQSLADDLGIKRLSESAIVSEGDQFFPIHLPVVWVGSLSLDLRSMRAFMTAANSFHGRDSVEGLLPGRVLVNYQVVIDYPKRLFAVGRSGSIRHEGQPVKGPFLPNQVHPRVELKIDGKQYGFLLDTGAKVTLVRRDLMDLWYAQHPNLPRSSGAVGPANMVGSNDEDDLLMLRLPEIAWNRFKIKDVAVACRSNQTFEASSQETTGPIVGALGGNVLSAGRIEIDYPHQMIYVSHLGQPDPHDMDTVGLVLAVDESGRLEIKGISPQASALTQQNLRVGDVLVGIKDVFPRPRTLTEAAVALSGAPGEVKHVVVKRKGSELTINVQVAHIL